MSDERPNILIITADQLRLNAIGAAGCSEVETPALDGLAARGTFFTESYTTSPVCLPARASWWTGRMPSETGIQRPKPHRAIRGDLPTLAEWLGERGGYEAIHAGKWHAPELVLTRHDQLPGFYAITTGIDDQGFIMDPHVATACASFLRNRDSAQPLLLVAEFMNPHDICEWLFLNTANHETLPYPEIADALPELPANRDAVPEGEPAAIAKFRRTLEPQVGYWEELHHRYYLWSYHRHAEAVDAEVGRILQALRETGREENTIVLFTSDHGEGFGCHRMTHKGFPYDEVCRVPLIVSWPGNLREGAVDETSLVSGTDIFPTLCDLAGVEAPGSLTGTSLRPALEAGGPVERGFVPVELAGGRAGALRTRRHKYVRYPGESAEMLFDLVADP
ncbi:MAG: sulfatase-like hydrolase/transferase, partial [Candidatus Brocadiaceae bacterium]